MTPIHKLLDRIRWDKDFGAGHIEIGYYDRKERAIERVTLKSVSFSSSGARRAFELTDDEGHVRLIPFHRIREVCRDGRIIWRREVGPVQTLPASFSPPKMQEGPVRECASNPRGCNRRG